MSRQKQEAYAASGQILSMNDALEEVVADGCETMLADNEQLSRFVTEHERSGHVIVHWLERFWNKLRAASIGVTASHAESLALEKSVKKLQEIWTTGLIETSKTVNESESTETNTGKASIKEIVGDSGTKYGRGVYLDSVLLENLSEDEQVEMVKLRLEELSEKPIPVYDKDNNAINVRIAKSTEKFKNDKGKRVPVNQDIINLIDRIPIKRSAIAQTDELLAAGTANPQTAAKHPHDWLDNNGENLWDNWRVYMQEKDNTVWEATLHIANSANGEKILYDIKPIKKVEGARKSAANTTGDNIPQTSQKSNTQNGKASIKSKEEYQAATEEYNSVYKELNASYADMQKAQNAVKPFKEENGRRIKAAITSDTGVDEALYEYKKWAESSGYDKAYAEFKAAQDRNNELYRKKQTLENELREYLVQSFTDMDAEDVQRYVSKAVRKYHTTSMLDKAAYLTTTGSMLDFSDGQRRRVKDHREISEVLDLPDFAGYSDGMIAFMNMGNIRLQTYGIEVSRMPNARQISTLRSLIRRVMSDEGEFTVDFSRPNGDNDGSATYYEGTSPDKIFADIKNYFDNGVIPNNENDLNQFRGDGFYDGYGKRSIKVTDKATLDFLNSQKTVKTYKSMLLVDGKLYPPMAVKVGGKFVDPSVLGQWEQAEERPDLIKVDKKSGAAKFNLNKENGNSVPAAYNPYMHSSDIVLNDQFTVAYTRNLVTVECEIPVSELTSGYKADYAKDAVGKHKWHKGPVAGALRTAKGIDRQVYMTRWLKPVRILSNKEVAKEYAKLLDGTDIKVPDNVVPAALLTELEKAGVGIDYTGIAKVEGRKDTAKGKASLKGYTADGTEVYETSDYVKSLPWHERRKEFIRLMEKEYAGRTAKFTRNGHTYYAKFESVDVEKNIYGDDASDGSGRDAKISTGADGGIFDLVENAEYFMSAPETGKKGKAHRGIDYWDYFIKTVQIDGKVYDELINVRKSSTDEYVYNIELTENKNKAASPNVRPVSGNEVNRVPTASKGSVSQASAESNTKNRKYSLKDADILSGKLTDEQALREAKKFQNRNKMLQKIYN